MSVTMTRPWPPGVSAVHIAKEGLVEEVRALVGAVEGLGVVDGVQRGAARGAAERSQLPPARMARSGASRAARSRATFDAWSPRSSDATIDVRVRARRQALARARADLEAMRVVAENLGPARGTRRCTPS